MIYVGIGGAIGSILRYLLSTVNINHKFPFMTFFINLIGCIIIGFLFSLDDNKFKSNYMLLLKTGFCGGFTTFSTFSLEALLLLKNKEYLIGSCYIILSLVVSLIGVLIGMYISKAIK